MSIRILTGDCREVLRTLPSESVQCVVTSPPYWGLRDYGIEPGVWGGEADCAHDWGDPEPLAMTSGLHRMPDNQTGGQKEYHQRANNRGAFCQHCGAWRGTLGLEPTPALYVEHMVEVFRELRRVLRKDGTLWLNLGDSYADVGRNYEKRAKDASGVSRPKTARACERCGTEFEGGPGRRFCSSVCGGSDNSKRQYRHGGLKAKDLVGIPWHVAFALQADGWWLRQDIIWSKVNPMPESVTDRCTKAHEYLFLLSKSERYYYDAEAIREGCSGGGHGGSPQNRGKKSEALGQQSGGNLGDWDDAKGRNKRSVWTVATQPFSEAHFATFPPALVEPCIKAGCPVGGTVLDPFGGAGTVGLVADRLGRDCILIELNPEYAEMARRRIQNDSPMFAEVS